MGGEETRRDNNLSKGTRFTKTKDVDGQHPVAGSNGIIGYHAEFTSKGPGITIGRSGNIGTPHFYKQDYWAHNTVLYVIDFKGNKVLFLYYFLKNINFSKFNTGSAVPSLNRNHIHKLKVAIPSLPEQTKIAQFLTAIDQRVAILEKKKTALEQYKKGMMQKLFSQEIRFKSEDGTDFPDWEEKRLGEVGKFKSGIGFSTSEQGGEKGVPFYKVSDMNTPGNEKMMIKSNNYVTDDQIKRNKYKVIEPISILFAKVGAAIFLERKRIAENFIIDNNMMCFTPRNNINFFFYLFSKIRLSKYAQVGALPSYNANDLKTIKIKIPSLPEQQKIADLLTAIDNAIQKLDQQIVSSTLFKQGLLQKMFV